MATRPERAEVLPLQLTDITTDQGPAQDEPCSDLPLLLAWTRSGSKKRLPFHLPALKGLTQAPNPHLQPLWIFAF